jgi:hypothetical protein
VYRIKKLKKRPRPNKGLYIHNNNNNLKMLSAAWAISVISELGRCGKKRP